MPASEPVSLAQALRQLLGMLTPARRRQLHRLLALMLLGALAEIAVIGSVFPFLAALTGPSRAPDLRPFSDFFGGPAPATATFALMFVAAVLLAGAIRLWVAWANQRFIADVGHDLALETQRRIMAQPYSFHVQRHSSEAIASLEKIQLLVSGVLQQAMAAAVAAVIGLAILALLVAIDPIASFASIGALALAYLAISRSVAGRLARHSQVLGTAYDERIKLVQESLGGIRDLIIDQSQPLYLDRFRSADARVAASVSGYRFLAGLPRHLIEPAAVTVVAGLAILLGAREGGLTAAIPALGAIALGGLRLLPMVQQAYSGWATMAANRVVVGQVLELLRLPVEDRPAVAEPLPFRENLALEDVSFGYPGRATPVLSGISLVIKRGERIALTGETGSGKSTLADLVMGLLTPDSGLVRIDGAPLASGKLRSWQRNIGHVSQSVFLADASIARNIALGVPDEAVDMARVREAATQAEIAGFIDGLPDGYETLAGERGARLSGGQRQRIAIARALYKRAPLLVLDEATNALDEETERRILDNLFADRERTILVIAHRASALHHCDRVIRLSAGRIAAGS